VDLFVPSFDYEPWLGLALLWHKTVFKNKHVLAPPPPRIWVLTSEASTYGQTQSTDVLLLSLDLIAVVSSARLNLSLAKTTFPHMKMDSLIPACSNKNNEH
jgi:hypothetical protein